MRLLYDILFFFFSLFYLPIFFIKGKHGDGFLERFGVVPDEIKKKLTGKNVIWIHAVSVGEMAQGVRLADAIRKRCANAQFVLTATTAAGREIAEKFKKSEDTALYFPVDFRASVRSFIRAVAPKALIILETEIWPNLLHELAGRKIPVFVMNGRISDRAFPRYRAMKFFLKRVLSHCVWIGAQDERMRARFVELGVDSERVVVTGNMKYDWVPPDLNDNEAEIIEHRFKTPGSLMCMAGSTHEGEEEMLLDVYKTLKAKHPFFKLLIAPRHLNRIESIEAEAYRKDIVLKKVSRLIKSSDKRSADGTVLLLDKMGVLANLYRIADFVFIGGSLVPYGGHNLIEPAFFEKPVVCGRFMENFKEMTQEFKKAEAVVVVQGKKELEEAFDRLIEETAYRQKLGIAAKKLIALHQGATERNITAVLQSLNW